MLHPTSLPSLHGIGCFDEAAYRWVDFLADTKQRLWQVLPLGPTGYGDSPYQSFSTFAGNPYLISLPALVEDGLLDEANLTDSVGFTAASRSGVDLIDYGSIYSWKLPLLNSVSNQFTKRATVEQQNQFEQFCQENADWLDDYALFMALKNAHNGLPWNQWSMELRSRQPNAIAKATEEQSLAIQSQKLSQWLFYSQWSRLKSYANERGIQIIGDIPIFVAMDSADAWSNPDEFFMDAQYQPTVVAGVPPDYFSETGQLWGNPLYRWDTMAENGYQWWLKRIKAALKLYDQVRIDHFRGFAGYWEVPAGEETAINGRWVDGPGVDLFETIERELGNLPIIAEDLGEITPDVIELRDRFNLPGMKVLQFAFGGDPTQAFLPHNYTRNFVVYSGTHDNDTSRGWYDNGATDAERDFFRRYLHTDGSDPAWTLISTALSSVADMAIVPLQDVLGLGSEARMNLPGRAEGNWMWRYQEGQLDGMTRDRLRSLTEIYGRG